MINNIPWQTQQIALMLQNQYQARQQFETNVPPFEDNTESYLEEGSEEERTLFVGNLDEQVTEELFYELFLQAGPIEKVNIPKKRSFGFVVYQHLCSIPYALKLFEGVQLCRKILTINPKSRDYNMGQRQHMTNDMLNINTIGALTNLFNVAQNMIPKNVMTPSDNRMTERRRDWDRETNDSNRRHGDNDSHRRHEEHDRFGRHQNRQRGNNRRRDQRNHHY